MQVFLERQVLAESTVLPSYPGSVIILCQVTDDSLNGSDTSEKEASLCTFLFNTQRLSTLKYTFMHVKCVFGIRSNEFLTYKCVFGLQMCF